MTVSITIAVVPVAVTVVLTLAVLLTVVMPVAELMMIALVMAVVMTNPRMTAARWRTTPFFSKDGKELIEFKKGKYKMQVVVPCGSA